MTNNPYLSPTPETTTGRASSTIESEASVVALAKPVFRAWERLRIVYILLLGSFTAMLAIPGVIYNGAQLLTLGGLIMIAEGAIAANVFYFAGPIVETYVRWLGYDRTWVRWLLFAAGTVLTAILAFVSLESGLRPDQN